MFCPVVLFFVPADGFVVQLLSFSLSGWTFGKVAFCRVMAVGPPGVSGRVLGGRRARGLDDHYG